MRGHIGPTRPSAEEKLLLDAGGNADTEAGVARALAWLAKQQNEAGYWEYDGAAKRNHVAATGMCLLPYLAAGETHKSAKKYQATVAKGLEFLKEQIDSSGELHRNMYAQGIATTALCEAVCMTKDESLKQLARKAVDYIVKAQAENGSWGYMAGMTGDTSILGWQIQALLSAKKADIPVQEKSFAQAISFLESVASDSGSAYGYRSQDPMHTCSAVGLLCRSFMGWNPRHPSLVRGIEKTLDRQSARRTTIRHVLLLLRHAGNALLRWPGVASRLEPEDAKDLDRQAIDGKEQCKARRHRQLAKGPRGGHAVRQAWQHGPGLFDARSLLPPCAAF